MATVTYQKNRSYRTIDASNEHEPRLADEKDIDLGLAVARLAAIIGSLYDLSYYDSPKCIKEKANSFAKNTLIPNEQDEAVGKSICQVAKAAGPSSREDMAKRWDTIPSEVRWKCINALENDRKTGRIPTIDYVILGTCIDYLMKK